jgi:outer membrane immunogenic protein
MKKIFLTTVSLGVLAFGSSALAADLPMKAPPAAALVYDWTGAYVGGFGGYAFGNQNLNNALGPAGFANFTTNWETHGAFGGGEIGYNWQSGNLVFGVEADGAGTNIQGRDNFALADVNGAPMDDFNKLKWVASLRARGGIAVDRLLLFFDGGWAVGDIQHTNTVAGGAVDTFTNHRSGLAAGGGIAYAMTDNLIGKIEYRYYDLGTYIRLAPLNTAMRYNVANTYSTVLLGLDFKFWGGGSAVVAKY